MCDKAKLEAGRNALAAEHEQERTQLEEKLAASAADITLLHAKIKEKQAHMEQVCPCHSCCRHEMTFNMTPDLKPECIGCAINMRVICALDRPTR